MRRCIDENKELVKSYLCASSIVVTSRYSTILNLLMKLKKSYSPNYVTSTVNYAIEFLLNIRQKRLDKIGI